MLLRAGVAAHPHASPTAVSAYRPRGEQRRGQACGGPESLVVVTSLTLHLQTADRCAKLRAGLLCGCVCLQQTFTGIGVLYRPYKRAGVESGPPIQHIRHAFLILGVVLLAHDDKAVTLVKCARRRVA